MFELSIAELTIALIIIALAAGLQSSIGFGFNILAVPILALIDPDLTPIPTIVMGIPLTFMVWQRERGHADLRGMGWLIAGRFPGSFIGAALLAATTRRFLDGFIAVVVLVAVAIMATGYTVSKKSRNAFLVGVMSGTTGAASAIGGPPLALLYHRDRGPVIRSTLALIFFIGQWVNLLALAVNGQLTVRPFQLALVLTPAMFLGYWSSRFFTERMDGEAIRVAVLAVSAAAGLVLLGRTLFG